MIMISGKVVGLTRIAISIGLILLRRPSNNLQMATLNAFIFAFPEASVLQLKLLIAPDTGRTKLGTRVPDLRIHNMSAWNYGAGSFMLHARQYDQLVK